jgi:uncharacterized repeat protein (TIGR01451 family)
MSMRRVPWMLFALSLVSGGLALAQTPDPFRVTSGFGRDGCAMNNPGFDVSGSSTVHDQRAVTCLSGFGQVEATAGPGFLIPKAEVQHTGFGSGTNMGSEATFQVPFRLTSSEDRDVPVSLNLIMAITVRGDQAGDWFVQLSALVDGREFFGGSRGRNRTGGALLPLADGAPHALAAGVAMVSTNTDHILQLRLSASAAGGELDQVVAAEAAVAFATEGLAFDLPEGVQLEDIPLLNLVGNHWTDPRLPPAAQDFIIDDTTTQSDLEAAVAFSGKVAMAGAGRTDLTLPNLTSVGCGFRVTDNPNLTSLVVPLLDTVGCDLVVARNPALQQVSLTVATSIDGAVVIKENGIAPIQLGTPHIGGSATYSGRGPSIQGVTADGATTVTLANPPLKMTASLPSGTFSQPVAFSVLSLGAEPSANGKDSRGGLVRITPLGAYRYSFGTAPLNADASLTFDVDVASLDTGLATTFLEALAEGQATLASRSDAPGSVYQASAVCADPEPPSAGGCVRVERFDAAGLPLPPGDPAVPALVRFTGLTAQLASTGVVILSPFQDTTPPVIHVPDDMVVEADFPGGWHSTFHVTATDEHDGFVPVNCGGPPGFALNIGSHIVTCRAHDGAGNDAIASFSVTVLHSTPTARSDNFTVFEDGDGTFLRVLENDTNPDGHDLTVTIVGPAAHGTAVASTSGVVYEPAPDYSGLDSFTYAVSEGPGGADTATVSVSVIPQNDPPRNTVPGPQQIPVNQRLFFSQAGGTRLAVSDVDVASDQLSVRLAVSRGTLTLGRRTGLAFQLGDGIADGSVEFLGTVADINAALEGTFFEPPLDFVGPANLTVTSNDLGHSGNGGPRSDSDVVSIAVGTFADLALTATDSPDPVSVGEDLTYSTQVVNHGAFGAGNVTFVQVLPASARLMSISSTQGNCRYVSALSTLYCFLGPMPDQGSATVTVVVRPTTRRAQLLSLGTVAGDLRDPDATNNITLLSTRMH